MDENLPNEIIPLNPKHHEWFINELGYRWFIYDFGHVQEACQGYEKREWNTYDKKIHAWNGWECELEITCEHSIDDNNL